MSFGVKTTKKTTYFPDEVLYSDSGQVVGYQNLYPVEDRQQTSSPGGSSPSGGVTSLEYGVEGGGSGNGGSVGSPTYVYVPGSAAPTDGDPLSYAGWLQGSTKYQAEQDRIRKEQQAQTDRQRQIVDANSAYMQGRALYGANAERMASMGLTNSGYGEYLMGKAYATQRGEVQNANRTAQQRIDQAYYEEGILGQQADAKYAEDLIGIKNQQNKDYTDLYNIAAGGGSLESIEQDSRWGGLTPEQQTTIKSVTTANSIKIRIDNGESLETIMADPASGWNDLTVDQQNTLNTYSTSKTEAKNAEIASNFDSYLTAINNGSATLADIQALPGWADMVGTDYAKQLQAAWDKREHGKKFNELLRNVQNGDLTEETLKQHADWAGMSEAEKDQLLDAADEYKTKKNAEIAANFDSYLTAINDGTATLDDIKARPGWADMVGTDYETQIQAAWDKRAKDELKTNASSGVDFSTIANDANYKNASEPDKTEIKTAFIDSFVEQSDYVTKDEFVKAIKEGGITDQADIDAAIKKWQNKEYKAMLNGSVTLSGKDIYSAYEKGIISLDQMNSYIKEKYGDKTAFKPNGTLSDVGAARNTDRVTITLADGRQSLWDVNKLPKGVTSDELDAFYGSTPAKTSRGEAHWVVYKGNIYISGKAGWKILELFDPLNIISSSFGGNKDWDKDVIITALTS